MSNRQEHAADDSDRELVFIRTLDAPRELVWKTWTDPLLIGTWWGPAGFTTTTHRMDVRPGGEWRFVMHGPDGTDYVNRVVYLEVVRPERLVYQHRGGDDGACEPVSFQVWVIFADEGSRTNLTMRMQFESKAALDRADRLYGAIEGARQMMERLAAALTLTPKGAGR